MAALTLPYLRKAARGSEDPDYILSNFRGPCSVQATTFGVDLGHPTTVKSKSTHHFDSASCLS